MRTWKTTSLLAVLAAISVLACGPANGGTSSAPGGSQSSAPAAGSQSSAVGLPSAEEIAWFDYDASAPLDVVERRRELLDLPGVEGVMRVDLTYASPHGGRVPAWVYEPADAGPHAGIVFMHGLPGSRDTRAELAARYALTGAVVIAISAPFARPDGPRERPVTLTEQDRTEQIQLIVDLRRAVDYLQAHPEVDADRLGYVGFSYGGAMGGLLAGVEHRIKAYALAVGDGGLVAHLGGPDDTARELVSAQEWQRWVELMTPIESARFVALAAPSELLFQNGRNDRLVPPADAERYQQAGSEPKTVMWYDSGHDLPVAALIDQARWLESRIGIDLSRLLGS